MSIKIFVGRTSPPLVTNANEHDDPEASSLSITLETMRSEPEGYLAGFHIKISGETEATFLLPEHLQQPGLGVSIALRVVASSFTMPRLSSWSSYKCMLRLVQQDLLTFSDPKQAVAMGTRSTTVIARDASIAALKAWPPLALQLSLTKDSNGDPNLSLLLAVGAAAELNSGACTIDKEDHYCLGHLPTSKTGGSLIQNKPYHPAWDVHLDPFFSKFIADLARSEQTPGDYMDAYEIR